MMISKTVATATPNGCATAPWVRLAGLLATAMLVGCVVGPDYETPKLALPAFWGSARQAEQERPPALERWWQRLRDPMLDGLIEEAVAGNMDVAAAKAAIREARANYRQTQGALLPSASGTTTAARSRSAASEGTPADTSGQFQAGFDTSWELDLFGANRRGAEAARYGVDAAEQELRSTLLTLVGDVASNYVALRGYQARIGLARRTAASQRETEALTRTRFDAGTSSAVDVANAAGLAAGTEATIPSLEVSFAETVHRLSVLTGQSPAALNETLKGIKPVPVPKLPIPKGIPADILLAHPAIRLAERQYAQYTARIGQAEAARYPSVSLTGSIATSGSSLGDLGKSSSISWSFGPSLTVPIFNGGQLAAAVDVARAQRDQYFIAYRSAVLTALEDVENASVSLSKERIRMGKLASSANHYREAASLARTLYRSGSSSFLDVLDAERSLYTAEDTLLQSRVAIATDYISLNKSLGGGWNGLIDSSKPEVVDIRTGPAVAR